LFVFKSLFKKTARLNFFLELTQEVQPGWHAQKAIPMRLEWLSTYMFRALKALLFS
jgi:hypothetical protein